MAAIEKRSRKEWQELDKEHYLHPFTDHKSLHEKRSRIITRAEGVYIFDADGKRILDGMSGLWCVNAGYGRQQLIDAATEQMKELPYYNSFFQCAHPPSIELASMIQDVAQPQFNRVFFAGSGSESNDTIIRMVRTYWDLMGQPERHTIISRQNAYHGSTVAAASLGGMKAMHKQSGLPIPGIVHVDQPYWFGSDHSLSPDEFGIAAARSIEDKIKEVDYGTRPDFMTFAKGVTSGYLPLGGVLVSDRVADVLIERAGEFFHGYTYSGHPAACAVAIANIKLIQNENLVDRIRTDIGPYLQDKWRALGEHALVGDTRMVGLMGAFEIVKNKDPLERFAEQQGAGTVFRDLLTEEGVCMRAVGNTIICAPPFVLSHAEADEMIDKTWVALDLARKALSA
jgi:putrescine aminotransferase